MSYLRLLAADYCSLPDIAAYDITNDWRIRMLVALDTYTGTLSFASKYRTADDERSWFLQTTPTSRLLLYTSPDGTHTNSQEDVSDASIFTDGLWYWIEVEVEADGDIVFRYATEGDGPGSLIDIPSAAATGVAMFSSTAPLEIGASQQAKTAVVANIKKFAMYDGATTVVDIDFEDLTAGEIQAGSFIEDSSNAATVTINGSTWEYVGPDSGTIIIQNA